MKWMYLVLKAVSMHLMSIKSKQFKTKIQIKIKYYYSTIICRPIS